MDHLNNFKWVSHIKTTLLLFSLIWLSLQCLFDYLHNTQMSFTQLYIVQRGFDHLKIAQIIFDHLNTLKWVSFIWKSVKWYLIIWIRSYEFSLSEQWLNEFRSTKHLSSDLSIIWSSLKLVSHKRTSFQSVSHIWT